VTADFKNTTSFEKPVKFSDKISTTGAYFVYPVNSSAAFASLHSVSGDLQKGVVTQNNTNQIGFYVSMRCGPQLPCSAPHTLIW
jgi:hypothetical protein